MVEKCRIIGENVRSIITPPCYKGFRPFPRRFLVFPFLLYRAERRCSIPKKRLNVSRRFSSIVCVVSSFRRDAFAETPVLLRPRLTHFICCFRFFHRKCSVFRQTTVVGIQGLFRSAGLQLLSTITRFRRKFNTFPPLSLKNVSVLSAGMCRRLPVFGIVRNAYIVYSH